MAKPPRSFSRFAAGALCERGRVLEEALNALRRRGRDVEAVHDARVAARRLRNALEVLDGGLPGAASKWAGQTKKLLGRLGAVRDCDVQRQVVAEVLERAGPAEKPGLSRLALRLGQQRRKLQQPMLDALDRYAEKDVLGSIRERLGPLVGELGVEMVPLMPQGTKAVRDRIEEFIRQHRAVRGEGDARNLHRLRIAAKHLRYTLEVFAPLARRLSPPIEYLKDMQDYLGELHDCDVWAQWLGVFIEEEGDRLKSGAARTATAHVLAPGIKLLEKDRIKLRKKMYRKYANLWAGLARRRYWQTLRWQCSDSR